VLVIGIAGCVHEPTTSGPEIPTINPVIGDASYVARFGRPPTADDDPTERIRTHLAYVEGLLRGADVRAPAPVRARRMRVLDHLHAYWSRGQFPASDATTARLPTFVDDRGVRCAVAYLAEQDLGATAITAINRRYRNSYIAQIDAPALEAWTAASGVTRAELAMIQPTYAPAPTPSRFSLEVSAGYQNSVDEDAALGRLSHLGMFRGAVRWLGPQNPWIGVPTVGLTGGVGSADGSHLAYDGHVVLGTRLARHVFGLYQMIGVTAGFGLDAIGDRIARSWTVPIDAYYYVSRSSDLHVGVFGGPRFDLSGDRGVGWRAGLGVTSVYFWGASSHRFAPHDLHVELAAERIADATFVGVSLSVATRSPFGWP